VCPRLSSEAEAWDQTQTSSAPDAGSFETEERIRLMGQGLVNGAGKVMLGLIAICLVPVMLRGLGRELFGLWLFASMVASTVATVADLGLQLTVIREVGAVGDDTHEVAPFVRAAANLYLRITIAGALVVIALGAALISRHHAATPEAHSLLAKVFVVVSIGFIADQMCAFQLSVLQGLRRFDLANLLAVSACILNAVAIVAVLAAGGRLLAVVEAEALVSILGLSVAYAAVAHIAPPLRQRPERLKLQILRPHMRFSLFSQLSVTANAALWNGPPMLIGLMLAPAGLVPYQLGSKFPLAAGNIAWELAAVMIPIASRHQRTNDVLSAAEAFEAATRWVTVLILPIFIILWIVGPGLLSAWLGQVPPGTLLVLRIMTVASALSAVDVAASSILTGRGMVGFLAATVGAVAVIALPLTALLLERIGPEGAAWTLLIAAPIAAAIMLRAAARECRIALFGMLCRIARDVWMPAVACACAAELAGRFLPAKPWISVAAVLFAGGLAYLCVYLVFGAREEERRIVRRGLDSLVDLLMAAAAGAYPALRAIARLSRLRPSKYPHLAALVYWLRDPYKHVRTFDCEYETGPDPWRYTTDANKRERHLMALRLVEGFCPQDGFRRVFEIGCAEGVFTEMLAPLCQSLTAVDFSEIALQRARRRRNWGDNVTFRRWDLRTDPIPARFELIVAMDVLGYIRRPGKARKVHDRLVAALRSGDLILACDFRESFDDSWLARRLHFGRWAIEQLKTHPDLETIKQVSTSTHEFAVLRKL